MAIRPLCFLLYYLEKAEVQEIFFPYSSRKMLDKA